MKQELHFIYAILFLFLASSQSLVAQDNLQVAYSNPSAVPDFLNICGDADTATVTIGINGLSASDRQNISATLNLFKGVELTSFLASQSSAGITLVSNADPNNPIFSLPDLGPSGITEVDVSFLIAAKCDYIDTLNQNNAIQVFDTWNFSYDINGSSETESDITTEYRDAFAVPSFTTVVNNTHGPARVGECFTREVVITNSGLDGFISQMNYENQQGNGIYVSSISANGVPLTLTKTVLVTGDTLISAMLDGTVFTNNTIGGGAGNNNGNFDPNETVTITENICVLNCNNSRASVHNFTWGCDAQICNVITTSDFIQIGEGAPNILFEDSGSLPNINVGYCQQGFYAFTFNNNGSEVDAGFGTMIDVQAGLGLNLDGAVNAFSGDDGFVITEITLAGVTLTYTGTLPVFELGTLPQFTSDPDGVGGLEDFDGDGFFDDLPVGESFEMTMTYEFDCTQAQQVGDGNCVNDFASVVEARIMYTDACAQLEIKDRTNMHRFSNKNSDFSTEGSIDAFVEQDTFYITHRQDRSVFSFEKDCNGLEEYRAYVVLPQGVTPVISEFALIRNPGPPGSTTPSLPLKNSFISNDTLYLIYDGAATAFIGGIFELQMAFEADCSAAQDYVFMPYEFYYHCPSCDCSHTWFCDTLQGPKLHVEEPPCPVNTFVCPVGLATKSFEVNRTTFGYTDATYTTPFDPNSSEVNKKAALSCDSVEMRVINVIGDTPVMDSIGVLITHDNIDESYDSIQTFIFNNANIRITNGGTEFFCTIDTNALSITTIDSTQFLNFDLHGCLTGLGLTLVSGDTVEFVGNFKVNESGPIGGDYDQVPNFRGWGYAMIDGVEEACDHFGEIFTLKRITTGYLWPVNSNFPKGCEDKNMEFSLILGNVGYEDYFPGEIRQAIKVDSFVLDFDPAILDAYSIFDPQVSILNHPIHGNNFFDVDDFELHPSGHYVVRFDTLTTVPPIVNGQSYPFRFRIRAVPSCESELGSSNDNNLYLLNSQIFFEDRYYAKEIGDGSCADQRVEGFNSNLVYQDPPTLSISPLSNPNFILSEDTAIWEVQFCNTSFISDAGISWISIDDPTGAIQVVSIEDITVPDSTPVYTIQQYGAGGENYFAFAPALLKGSAFAPVNDICNIVRIKALVNNCGNTNFNARVGWNCVAYDDPMWTPELYPPCVDVSTPLSVTTMDPALDANIIEQPTVNPDICDTSTIAILLRNTDLGVAKEVATQIIIPMDGVTIIPGSFEIAYPSGAPYQPVAIDPTFMGTSSRGDIYEYSDFSNLHTFLNLNGLPGFDPNNPTVDSNQVAIRYQFVTDCDFISGSINYYSFQGLKNCGDSTNYETGESLPININGVNGGSTKIFDVDFSAISTLIPNSSAALEITATNLTTTLSDNTDKVSLMLPMGVTYEANSSVAITPGSWTITEPTIEMTGGYQILKWDLPIGLAQSESATFTFSVISPDFDCSLLAADAGLNTIESIDLFCDASGANCSVEANTSTNNGALTALPIAQNTLNFNFANITSDCSGADEETISVSGVIENTNTAFPSMPFDVEYYFDTDNSGNINTGDQLVATFTENGPIAAYGSIPISHAFPVTDDQVCGIIAYIDSTGLGICEVMEVPLGEPQLLNAGNDQIFCEINPTTISANLGNPSCGSISNYTFNWLAISPASTSDLSATNIANPVLTVNHNAVIQDTLRYILETTRPICGGVTRDTVSIIRALGITLNGGPTVFVQPGGSTTLSTTLNGGFAPFTYNWSPTGTLSDPNISNPIANPTGDTDYMVTVTSASGCSAVATVEVRTSGAITATVQPFDSTICNTETVQFIASGGTAYTWLENPANPTTGNLSNYNIPNPIFSNGNSNSVYEYEVVVEDLNFPGFFDTADVVITTLVAPDVQINSSTTTFICAGDESILTATGADTYEWFDVGTNTPLGTGDQITVEPTVLTTYEVIGTDTITGCTNTEQIQLDINQPTVLTPIADISDCSTSSFPISIEINENITSYFISTNGLFQNDVIVSNNTLTFDAISNGGLTVFDVTLTGAANGCDIIETFTIAECPCDGIDVESIVTVQSSCGNAEGLGLVNVAGNASDYTYTWIPNIGTPSTIGNQRDDLPFGGYQINIQSTTVSTCLDSAFLLIENMDGPDASDLVTTPATCSAADGSTTILPANFIYDWENGFTGNTRSDLTAGTHFVTITDPADTTCQNAMMIVIEENNPLTASVTVNQLPDCGDSNGSVTITVAGGSGSYAYSWAGGTDTNNSLASGMNTVTITDLGGAGCELIYDFVLTDNVPQGNVMITDTLEISCAGATDGGIAFDVIYDAGFNAPADTIITDGVQTYANNNLPPGDYCIVITDAAGCTAGGACFTVVETTPLVLDFTVIPDCNMGGSIDLEVQGGTPPYLFDWDDLAGANDSEDRDSLANGTYVIDLLDASGCMVNFPVVVPVCPDQCDFFGGLDTIGVEGNCTTGLRVCIDALIADTANYEIYNDGVLYSGNYGNCNVDSIGVYTYSNLWGQGNSGPYQITSWMVNGTTFTGEFLDIPALIDSMNLWDPNGNWAQDPNGGQFIVGGEQGTVYSPIDVEIPLLGVTSFLGYSIGIQPNGFYIEVEQGMHEVIVIDLTTNCADTAIVNANCGDFLPDSFCDTTFVGVTETWCLDASLFPGPILSVENTCLDSSGTEVEFFVDFSTLCVEYTGLAIGQDTACIEVCDQFGNCDTIILCTTVSPSMDLPNLNDDYDTVAIDQPVVVNIKLNDTIVGGIDTVYILDDPLYGEATLNLDCSVTYNAGDEFCERLDSFTYVVCNPNGCDTATVFIWLECTDIVIFTAVSPNGDGINDIFFIANIEDYPNSVLNIYNRWGNLVYNTKGYKNDWEGTFNNRKELPDGTYYYVLELNDPEDSRVFQGYLEIYR